MKKYIFIIILLLAISRAPRAELAAVRLETGLPTIPATGLTVGQELPEYINYLFIFGLGAIAVLALGMMMYGGIQYILAAGNVATKLEAKETITQALIGLGLLLISYLLLKTINPDLVNLKNPSVFPKTLFQGQIPPGMSVEEPPQSGRPSVFIYSVASPEACANIGGQVFSPCQTYCLATPGLCRGSAICCGKKP